MPPALFHMPAWVTIDLDDLNDYSAGEKVAALVSAALAVGQTDPSVRVIPDVVAIARGYLAARGQNLLSATANSVPPEAKTHVCWLIIEALQARLPGLVLMDEERRMIDRAWEWLRDVAKGAISIATPDDPIVAEVQAPAAISVVEKPVRVTTRSTLSGL